MTIFLKVLIKIIKEQLNVTSITLEYQSNHPSFYDQLLSSQKKVIIDALESKIVLFVDTGNDEADSKAITKLIEEHRVLIQEAQEARNKSRDTGETLTMLSNLIFHTNAFYTKVDKFKKTTEGAESSEGKGPVKLCLIDHLYYETPEHLIYYYALRYLAEEIFKPATAADPEIRAKKEAAVCSRLQSLSELIKPQFGLDDRKERAIQALVDLSSDNNKIITPPSPSSFGIPFFSVAGILSVKVPTTLFNPREGSFGKLFSLAESEVKKMTEAGFHPAPAEVLVIAASSISDDEPARAASSTPV